jgi:hypothetical protein
MDADHLVAALRYLAFNPVRAGLARILADWPHASVGAHLRGRDDPLVSVAPALQRVPRFADLLDASPEAAQPMQSFEAGGANGRPMGSPAFVAALEDKLGRPLAPRKRGPNPTSAHPATTKQQTKSLCHSISVSEQRGALQKSVSSRDARPSVAPSPRSHNTLKNMLYLN